MFQAAIQDLSQWKSNDDPTENLLTSKRKFGQIRLRSPLTYEA